MCDVSARCSRQAGRHGIFPNNFVELIGDDDGPNRPMTMLVAAGDDEDAVCSPPRVRDHD